MGYICHHAIIVTGSIDDYTEQAHKKAEEIFNEHGLKLVSPMWDGAWNCYRSFCIYPDGSKEGWEESDRAEKLRRAFIVWLKLQVYEDGSSPLDWALVQFGDEMGNNCLLDDSYRLWGLVSGD